MLGVTLDCYSYFGVVNLRISRLMGFLGSLSRESGAGRKLISTCMCSTMGLR